MKRVFITIVTLLTIYSIYYDLNYGTLPSINENTILAKTNNSLSLPYFEKKVQPGQTVLSIVEAQLNQEIPVSITHIIKDFKILNNGINPEEIQSGKLYKFPDYRYSKKNE